MVATRCPKFIRATARCMAMVDFPVPPFSLPTTMTCAEAGRLALACTNMTQPCYSAFSTETPPFGTRSQHCEMQRHVIVILPSDRRRQLVRALAQGPDAMNERKSTRLNSSHVRISYAVFCLKKKKRNN